VLPEISPATADALRAAFLRADYRTDGVRALLGREAHAALGRGEPEPAFRATADGAALGVLVRLLLLGVVEPDAAVGRRPRPAGPRRRRSGRAAAPGGRRLGRRPGPAPARADSGMTTGWRVVGALRPRRPPPGARPRHGRRRGVAHAGVGDAAHAVGTVLDLGTGCGVQALHASRHARAVTATDVAPRALAMARATFALNGWTWSCSTGRGWPRWPGAGST
jgi:hypothetical protein